MHNKCSTCYMELRLDSRSVDDDGSFYLMNNFFVQIFSFCSYFFILFILHYNFFLLYFSLFFLFSFFYARFQITFYFLFLLSFCYDKKNWNKIYKGCAGIRTCCYIPVGTFDARWCKRTG